MSEAQWQQSAWSRWVILGGIALGGITGCLVMYHALVVGEQSRREVDFRLQVQQRFHTIEEHVRSTLQAVEAVGFFFRASQYVSPEEFQTFARPLLHQYPGLHEVGWAGPNGPNDQDGESPSGPLLPTKQDSLPKAFSEDSKEPSSQPSSSPSANRKSPDARAGIKGNKIYIYYLEAEGTPFLSLGQELSSLEGGSAIVTQLLAGRSEVAIGPIVPPRGGQVPLSSWQKVYLIGVRVDRRWVSANGSAGSALGKDAGQGQAGGKTMGRSLTPSATSEGVVFGVFQPWLLMEEALRHLPPLGIDVYWYEGEVEQDGQLICYRPGLVGGEWSGPVSGAKLTSGLHAVHCMELFGEPWRLYGAPTAVFLAERSSLIPEMMLMGGLSMLCVLLAYVHLLFSRHTQVRDLVERRTRELQKTKEDLAIREQSLRDSQMLYSSLVEGLPVPILRKNREGRFTFANQAFCRLLKRPLEEILGKTDFDFYPPDLAEKYRADDCRVMETGEFLETVEENVQGVDRKYVQVIKFPVRDAAGQVLGVQVIFWDITDRRRAELALEQERLLLQSLMDQLPHNIYFKDQQSRFLRINRAMARYFGLAHPSEAEGKTDFDFFTREHAEQALADEQYILATGRPILNKEEKETWPDGRVTWVSTTKLPLRDAEGRIVGTYGISQEITEQKLASESLKAAKEAAETASQAKSRFLANVSHEIRTPLHALLGLTELVLEGTLEPSQRAYVEMIRDAGENLLMVLNDLLDFSKIEAGHLELEQIPFRLRELVGETLKSFAFLAHGKGLVLVWFVHPDVPEHLVGDPLRVRQVLSNLVGNAVKFTDQGEIHVEVHCLDRQPESVQLQFHVRDTGIGIPAEKLENIFQMFEQVDRSTTRKYGGTGLGLAICSRLVASMQGRIWAESQVGQGTTFSFTARFGLWEEAEPWPDPQRLVPLQNRPIFLLEPHPLERQNLEGLLRTWGLEPISAGSWTEAKAYTEKTPPGASGGIVLMASPCPEAEKNQLAEWLAQQVQPDGCVIWMTPAGCTCSGLLPGPSCREAVLIKPYKPSELLEVLVWAAGEKKGPPPSPRRLESDVVPCLPPLRILVAEDSLVGQQLAVGLLERYGHQVHVVRTGREAVAAVQREPFDVVLMDLHMPEMDGWEATQAIRNWEKETGGHIPIIALTAGELSEEQAKVESSGMDAWITKPLRTPQLFQAIEQLLRKTPLAGGQGGPKESSTPAPASQVGIDWEAAWRAVRGEEALLRSVVQTLLHEAPQLLQRIREAFAHQDAHRFHLAMHTLKGSVRIFGNTSVYAQAWAMEQLAGKGLLPLAERVDQLEDALRQLLEELTRRFPGTSSEGSSNA